MSEKNQKILEWIFPGSFEARHKSFSDTRAADSGVWFMNRPKVKQWMESDTAELLICIGNRKQLPLLIELTT
jgi:hypothetical protein